MLREKTMANLICTLDGVRGRTIKVFDNKCEITTDVTLGSVITNNATDGTKTIFYVDYTGIQFKESGLAIGFLQLETPSNQMNNEKSNFFSENTFTFQDGTNGVTNLLMRDVYKYIVDRMEGYKYQDNDLLEADLPKRLAELYGKSRPVLKREIEQEKKEQAEKAAKALEEKNRRMAEAAEKMKSGDVDRRLLKFFAAIEGTNRFANIAKEWEAQGLSGDPLYSGIEADIEKRAKVERLYGPTHDNGRISAFIDSLKEQTGIVL